MKSFRQDNSNQEKAKVVYHLLRMILCKTLMK